MRISDWSSDVCSSDLQDTRHALSACPDLAKLVAGYSGAHFVQIVAPPLVHGDTLLPIAAPVIDAANAVGIGMGKRPLDGLRGPFAALVQQGGGNGPQAMRRHFTNSISHPPERLIDGVFAQRSPRRVERRKDVAVRTS